MPVHGKVFEMGTNNFIRNALVVCNELSIEMPFNFPPYNITGCYLAHGVHGIYTVKASAPGYKDGYEQVTISNKLEQKNIFLSPSH